MSGSESDGILFRGTRFVIPQLEGGRQKFPARIKRRIRLRHLGSEAPPVNLLFRSSMRRIARVRLFIDFVTELFGQLEARRGPTVAATDTPYWLGRHYGRSSAMLTRQR
jgi:hypothetical protein